MNDERKSLDVVYLDFQKTFNKTPHQKLLYGIKQLGIDGKVHQWVARWLSNIQLRVVINGITSERVHVTSGVPQVSAVGPVLLLIYICCIILGLNNLTIVAACESKV